MDLTTKTAEIAKILIERGETVAVGESSAGGLVSASLLAVSGASKYFMGGGVIYTHRARKRLVKIDFKDHPGVRSSSEPYATGLVHFFFAPTHFINYAFGLISGRQRPRAVERDMGFGGNRSRGADRKQLWRRCRAHALPSPGP